MLSFRRTFSLILLCPSLLVLIAACGDDGGLDTDYPSAGEDRFELTRATVEIEVTLPGVAALPLAIGELESVELKGPALIMRGDPQDEDGNGLVEVETEIVSMELTGTASFGPIIVRQSPERPSTGTVEQQEAGQDFPANSFFDVFVEVEIADLGLIVHNEEPLRMEAELSDLPPGEDDQYLDALGRPLPIFTEQGIEIGRIVDALHIPNPGAGPAGTPEKEETPETTATTATAAPTPTPTEEPIERLFQQLLVRLRAGCEHTQPGVQSDLVALVLLSLVGAEPVDSATVKARAEGAGVINPTATGVTGADGTTELRFPINQFGQYDIMVEQVIGPDGQPLEIDPASQTSVMIEVGEVCSLPPGF